MAKGDSRLQCPQCFTINPDESRFCSKCGSSLSELFETMTYAGAGRPEEEKAGRFTAGQMFDDRYRIIEEIGRGGMGRVFKAEDTALGITVALKVIRPSLSSDPRFVDRFKKEMLLARSISHENVIRIFDLGEAHGTKYISMEYIKGQSLKDFVHSSGTLSIETVTHIARQIGEALKVAHDKGIVHQDLKPSNIVVDQSGRAYILDFGLAKAVRAMAAEREGESAGTPQYMSPEQATGGKVGPASDIYSYGAVLYEMVTGKPMFEAETPAEYKKKHASERPAPPARINPHLPRPLEHIILRCLEKDPAKRYGSMVEVLAELGRVEEEQGKPSFLGWLRKNWAYAASLVLLAGIAAAVYFIFIKPPPPPERRQTLAVVYLMNNTGDKGLDRVRYSLPDLLIADLLQSQYIRVATGNMIYGILKSQGLLDAPAYALEDLKKVAALARADYIFHGSFTKAGDAIRVTAVLYRAQDMEPVKALSETGDEASFWAMAENMSRQIKEGLSLSAQAIAADRHKDLKKITTGSPEAFKYYSDGKRYFNEQKFEECVASLEKAVALDPEYAMAYLLMSEAYGYLQDNEKADRAMTKARSFLNRVSDRDYYMIQAALSPNISGMIDAYKKLLAIYPDDSDALGYLGGQYRNLELWDLAAAQFEKVLTIDDSDELAYENMAVIYSARGEYLKAMDLLRSKQGSFARYFGFHNRMAMVHLILHEYEPALAEARKARDADPTDFEPSETEGLVQMLKGDAAAAEAVFRKMAGSGDPFFRTYGRFWLCHLCLARGRYGQLREEVQAGLAQARTDKTLTSGLRTAIFYAMNLLAAYERQRARDLAAAYEAATRAVEAAQESQFGEYIELSFRFRGAILAAMKKFDEAALTAEKLKETCEKDEAADHVRYLHLLQGEIAAEKGDLEAAVASFRTALTHLPRESYKTDLHILYLDTLASALVRKGDRDGAQSVYEQILGLTTGRVRYGDLYALSHYQLGRIHQAKNERDKAASYYRKFLEIWSQADPGLPEILDARTQLAGLGLRPSP
jgi:tetratricopeptide (TPR) repeat protein/predicted Ser/Thr protein kinase